ncbi:MAG TPA: EAL domain-containing protein [Patescibacteria group bacterium]|nr:EAL domain-containing protein [Patescibacteria group bacterium]
MTEPLRVLIVEDRPSDAELMVLRLEEEGFAPDWVRVEDESAYLAELEARPDLILSDWSLPRFSCLGALRAVRRQGLDIPFVIVSGSVGEEAAIDALHEGADDYVLKDRLARLGPAVRRALEAKGLRDAQRRSEVALRQAAMVFESTTEGVTLTDVDGTIVAVNRAFVEITGYTEEEVLGRNPRILQSGRQDETFYRDLWATLTATGRWRGEMWNRRPDGEVYPAWMTISAVKDEQGGTTNYVGVFSDIGEVKLVRQQLDFLAHHDALTGLPNRTLLLDRLEQAIRRANSAPRKVGVLILDIDRFRSINDGLGHAVGDRLLQAVANRIAEQIGPADTLARFGGDEFVVMVGYAQSAAHVAHLARDFLDRLAMPFSVDGREIVVTGCAGASLHPTDGSDAATLLRLAQTAMRQAKVRGRNTMAFVETGVVDALEDRLGLERLLRGAASRSELVVHYQPQVDLADRSLLGVEALVRWQHPERGLMSPGEFIPLAEEMGIIGLIGGWVLVESCRQIAAWQVDGFLVPRVSVNLSAQQLELPGLATTVWSALDAADIGPERLELEVTESMIMQWSEVVALVLANLRALGIELALDDFGTGHSSLAQLRRLPLRRLKIDISFVREIGRDPASEAIIRAIIAMAAAMGLQTVAEGVEEEHQATFLRDAGCDIGQGYLFGRPVPADVLLEAWAPGSALNPTRADR